jgi:VWFA-related protein
MKRTTVVAATGLAWSLTLVAAQQAPTTPDAPQATFRTGVEVVQLDVSVLDKNRQPVRGLTAADFTVIEDGKPQRIVAFKAVDLPDRLDFAAPWMRDVAPDVVTNHLDADRVVVLLLDDFHTPYDPMVITYARRIARRIVEELGPADMAAVVYTFSQHQGQEFTTDRARLAAAVDRFLPSGFSGPYSAACPNSECVTRAFRNVAESLRGWPGLRKSVVYISPQAPFKLGPQNIEQYAFEANVTGVDSGPDLQQTFAAMQQANVNVYQFDPLGVTGGINADFGIFAESTGGRAFTNTNAPWERVPEMFRENSSYYVVGFQSSNDKADAHFRPVKVTVSRPNVDVRARAGYFAPATAKPGKNAKNAKASNTPVLAVDKAMGGALPVGDLPISLTVAPFAVPGRIGSTVAVVAGLDLSADLPVNDTVELAARALNVGSDDWKSHGVATARLALTRPPAATGTVHYDVPTRLDLAPGRYEIRVAITSPATGHTGSVYAPVTVPNFVKEPLTLSGVVLGRVSSVPSTKKDPLGDLLPLTPTTVRAFTRRNRVDAFLQIYQGGKTPVPVHVTTRLTDQEGHTAFEQAAALGPDDFHAARSASQRIELPLARLTPGAYLLSIEAVAGKTTARRDVRFQIK